MRRSRLTLTGRPRLAASSSRGHSPLTTASRNSRLTGAVMLRGSPAHVPRLQTTYRAMATAIRCASPLPQTSIRCEAGCESMVHACGVLSSSHSRCHAVMLSLRHATLMRSATWLAVSICMPCTVVCEEHKHACFPIAYHCDNILQKSHLIPVLSH